ncbi:hypothetical protein P8C59_007608 [Phyllachora maydis]|uniref:Uncharacterized protein n=1 Tax=Phyllachora maydis TaxID=1825666 RepID=A0AAD9MDQ8_9PEZI|nr:hypothetical protein P8C59_007608 [Phyllachora maydis]
MLFLRPTFINSGSKFKGIVKASLKTIRVKRITSLSYNLRANGITKLANVKAALDLFIKQVESIIDIELAWTEL